MTFALVNHILHAHCLLLTVRLGRSAAASLGACADHDGFVTTLHVVSVLVMSKDVLARDKPLCGQSYISTRAKLLPL